MSAAARLTLLVPWLNGEVTATREIQRAVVRFVRTFDGTADAAFIEARRTRGERITTDALTRLRQHLGIMLRYGIDRGQGPDLHTRVALQIGTGRRPSREKRLHSTRTTRQQYQQAGAYTLRVTGTLEHLTVFLVLHLLTAPGMVDVIECAAPAPYDWAQRCGRLQVRTPGRGHPRLHCSDACRQRAFQKAEKVRFTRTSRKKARKA